MDLGAYWYPASCRTGGIVAVVGKREGDVEMGDAGKWWSLDRLLRGVGRLLLFVLGLCLESHFFAFHNISLYDDCL